MRLAVGLLHWPIYDGKRNIVATNITNLDVHDIARSSRVYGVERYYLIHPGQEQLMFVHRLLDHWRIGEGAKFNPMRKTALTMVHTASNLEAALADWGGQPTVVGTHARQMEGTKGIGFRDLGTRIKNNEQVFLLFGTGFGMTEDVLKGCDYVLEPIRGYQPTDGSPDYRHLSVRSAASICLDRLIAAW